MFSFKPSLVTGTVGLRFSGRNCRSVSGESCMFLMRLKSRWLEEGLAAKSASWLLSEFSSSAWPALLLSCEEIREQSLVYCLCVSECLSMWLAVFEIFFEFAESMPIKL